VIEQLMQSTERDPLRVELESGPLGKDQTTKRIRFAAEPMIGILKEQELGVKTADVCRTHGISEATFYNWKSKYGGMDVSEAKRLKQVEAENGKLKRLLADAMLDNFALKDLLSKTW
jgi:putative transposase